MGFGTPVVFLILPCFILSGALLLGTNKTSQVDFLTTNLTVNMLEGETVTFPCVMRNNATKLWFKETLLLFVGSQLLTTDMQYKVQGDGSSSNLTVSDITPSNEGEYRCQINLSPVKEQINKLYVNIPPTIVHQSAERIDADLMQNVTLNCSANGKPEPIITWTKQGSPLPNGDVSFRGKSLILTKLDGRHNGVYVCTASNGAGNPAKASITLNIEFGARLLREGLTVEHTGLGESLNLVCGFEGNPRATATWYKSGQLAVGTHAPNREMQIQGQHGEDVSLLHIQKVTTQDLGDYQCVVNNTLGSANSTFNLTGLPMKATIDHTTHAAFSTKYTLRWTITSHESIEVFRINYKTSGVENITDAGEWETIEVTGKDSKPVKNPNHVYRHSYIIMDLTPSTAYDIKITAKNSFGWGDESDVIVMETRKDDLTTPPPNMPTQQDEVTGKMEYTIAGKPNKNPGMSAVGTMSGSEMPTCRWTSLLCIVIGAVCWQHL